MRTDAHRLGGYGILPYPRSHLLLVADFPTERTKFTEPPAEKSLPQIAQMSTDYWGRRSPTEFTVPSAVFCEICGRKLQQESSVNSVNSVGESYSKKVL